MTMYKRGFILFTLALLFVSYSCQEKKAKNPEDFAWETVSKSKTLDAYKSYVLEYPQGKYSVNAMKKIDEEFVKMMNDTSQLLSSFDAYKLSFPQGGLLEAYEKKIFQYASLQGDSIVVQVYKSRFPNGKYIQASDTGEGSDYKKVLTGEMSISKFMQSYSSTTKKIEIERWLADSIQSTPSIALYNQYMNLFPDGESVEVLKKMEEDILYKAIVKTKRATYLKRFLKKYPTSSFISKTVIRTFPKDVAVEVLDSLGLPMKMMMSRDTLKAVVGMKFKIRINDGDFESLTKLISIDKNRSVEDIDLKYSAKFILFERFENANSAWARNGSDYTAKVEGGKLMLSTESPQVEILKKQNIDFKRDFSLKMRFKFVKKRGGDRNYVGLLWGDKSKTNYFFVDNNGKAGYGNKDNRALSSDNNFAYDGWSRSWLSVQTYKKNAFNEIVVKKVGRNIRYTLNGLTISAFQMINTPRDRFIGIGFGETEVLIDQIVLKQ